MNCQLLMPSWPRLIACRARGTDYEIDTQASPALSLFPLLNISLTEFSSAPACSYSNWHPDPTSLPKPLKFEIPDPMYSHLVKKFRREREFNQVSSSEDCETLLPDSERLDTSRNFFQKKFWTWRVILSMISSYLLTFLAGALVDRYGLLSPASFCIQYTSQYSPVLKDVNILYSPIRFEGSFMNENVFRQNSSPAVDAAWKSLGIDYRVVVVPPDQASKSGLLPDQVKLSEKYGGGYPANVEGLHHLHCLNLLRRSLYYNYDYYKALGEGAFKNDEPILRYHVTHCLDILRQQLMCTVDIAVLGQIWWNPKAPTPFVDFNTVHKCRNFDAIRQWAEEHQAPEDPPRDYLQAPVSGDKVYEAIP